MFCKNVCVSIVFYADDILLVVAYPVLLLFRNVRHCDLELEYIDMSINLILISRSV